ncbi:MULTISPECIES: hypothetical protein [Butyricimonas]|uniref:hypothetical protein n=1 Tax=Butyricimonas TaxID=574697 RepID=UPI001D060C7A|nr:MULTISPECIES: hypothetical protein [Butyricimonas]MCB6970908.1 hypothetical protein [Butyricimonas synergistica]MCG4517622.1 hypothetical protein [Butyricimonas sp. DFI.6.44]
MKKSTYSLNMLSLLLVFVISGNSMAQETSLKKQDLKTKAKVTSFFSAYLSGKEKVCEDKATLKLSDVKKMQNIVWEAWKDANNNFTEEKLIDLEKLDNTKSGKWTLPAELEPNAIMPYYWGFKGETIPENGYPLYLYTHGSGHKDAEWKTGISICKNFDDAPSVYFIPQIPNMGDYYRWWQKAKQYAWEKMLRLAFVTGKINPNKVYFFGISEGGYGSQRLASFYADYLAGAGPMAGGEPLKNAPVENCRNIAFSLRTGALDRGFYRNKLTQYTKDEFDRLEKLYPGSFIHYIELIPGMGHGIDYKPTTPWLKQYTRNPYPKFVSWENFEMDGLYRDGFYNLAVKERSNDDTKSRTYYELNITDNHIALKADVVTYKATEIDPNWGIELKCEKNYQSATKGKVIIYLCEELVNLDKEITLTVNGKEVFKGKVKPELKHIVNSCATFFDPARLYPAAIEVDIANL